MADEVRCDICEVPAEITLCVRKLLIEIFSPYPIVSFIDMNTKYDVDSATNLLIEYFCTAIPVVEKPCLLLLLQRNVD